MGQNTLQQRNNPPESLEGNINSIQSGIWSFHPQCSSRIVSGWKLMRISQKRALGGGDGNELCRERSVQRQIAANAPRTEGLRTILMTVA